MQEESDIQQSIEQKESKVNSSQKATIENQNDSSKELKKQTTKKLQESGSEEPKLQNQITHKCFVEDAIEGSYDQEEEQQKDQQTIMSQDSVLAKKNLIPSLRSNKLEPSKQGNLNQLKQEGYENLVELENDDFDQMISEKIKRVLKAEKIDKIINEIEKDEEDELMVKVKTKANELFKKGFKGKKDQIYDEIKYRYNLENKQNPDAINSERMLQLQRMLVRKHRQLFFQGWDDDQAVIHNMNKSFILQQLKPFNEKLVETRIQMVELYAWIQRLTRVLKKVHVTIFKGLSNIQDEQDMQGPYERKNQTIDQGTILELNVIGRKDYDNVKIFQSYIPDKEKKSLNESKDIQRVKSDLGSDGQSLQDLLKDEFNALEQKHDQKILKKISSKEPLLSIEKKMQKDLDMIATEFAGSLELIDIVQNENKRRFNQQNDQELNGSDQPSIVLGQNSKNDITFSLKRDRSVSPNVPYKQPLVSQPEHVDVYFHNIIEPVVDENLDYMREPRTRLVIPEITTDTIFDQYNRTINKLNEQLNNYKLEANKDKQQLELKMDDLQQQIKYVTSKFGGTDFEDQMYERINSKMQSDVQEKMTQQFNKFLQDLENIKDHNDVSTKEIKTMFGQMKQKMISQEMKFATNKLQMNDLMKRMELIKESQKVASKATLATQKDKLDIKRFETYQNRYDGFLQKVQQGLDEAQMKIQTLNRFVDRYQPIKTQSQISETLHLILGSKSLMRLETYEMGLFRNLNYRILEDKVKEKDRVTEDINLEENFHATIDKLISILEGSDQQEEADKLKQANKNSLNAHGTLTSKSRGTFKQSDKQTQNISSKKTKKVQSQAQKKDSSDSLQDSDEFLQLINSGQQIKDLFGGNKKKDEVKNDYDHVTHISDLNQANSKELQSSMDKSNKLLHVRVKSQMQKSSAVMTADDRSPARPKESLQQEIQESKQSIESLGNSTSEKEDISSNNLRSHIDHLIKERDQFEKMNLDQKKLVALDHMLQFELEKTNDLRTIFQSDLGELTDGEREYNFKIEHLLKIQKTFLSLMKYQEERYKFTLEEVQRQFQTQMKDHETMIWKHIDKESQVKIERVLLFDEKIDSLNKLEIQLKAKILSMQEKVEMINEQIKEQFSVGENNDRWQYLTEWLRIQNMVDQAILKNQQNSIYKISNGQQTQSIDTQNVHVLNLKNNTLHFGNDEYTGSTGIVQSQMNDMFESQMQSNMDQNTQNATTGIFNKCETLIVTPQDPLSRQASQKLIVNELLEVNYKGHKLQLSDLIEMRLLLVDKIEEIMSRIWKEERIGLDEQFILSCKRNIFDDMVSFFMSAKLKESVNDKKSQTSTMKETELVDNKSCTPSEKPITSRNTFVERKRQTSLTKRHSNSKVFLSQGNIDINKMYSSVDVHEDHRDSTKLQSMAKRSKPQTSGSTFHQISQINYKFPYDSSATFRKNPNEHQSKARFLVKNSQEFVQKYQNSLTRKDEKSGQRIKPLTSQNNFRQNHLQRIPQKNWKHQTKISFNLNFAPQGKDSSMNQYKSHKRDPLNDTDYIKQPTVSSKKPVFNIFQNTKDVALQIPSKHQPSSSQSHRFPQYLTTGHHSADSLNSPQLPNLIANSIQPPRKDQHQLSVMVSQNTTGNKIFKIGQGNDDEWQENSAGKGNEMKIFQNEEIVPRKKRYGKTPR